VFDVSREHREQTVLLGVAPDVVTDAGRQRSMAGMDGRGIAGFLAGVLLAVACEAEPPPATWPQPGDSDPALASAYAPATAHGPCITIGQVKQTIGSHWVDLRRNCWESNASTERQADVTASITIGPEGDVKDSRATGSEESVARCVQSSIRGWQFPAIGCLQRVQIPFRFVRTGPRPADSAASWR
jgi:hypothetical protein